MPLKAIDCATAGKVATRAMNQHCSMHSRQKNGGRAACTKVSSDIAMKPPTSRSGFRSGLVSPTNGAVETTKSPYQFAWRRLQWLAQARRGKVETGSVLAYSPLLPAAQW